MKDIGIDDNSIHIGNRLDEIGAYLEKKSFQKEKKQEEKTNYDTFIYFFSTPYKEGICMADCSPKGTLARFAGNNNIEDSTLSKKIGTFITKKKSLTDVSWDDSINEVNKANYVKQNEQDDLSYVIYTFIISDEELEKIRDFGRNNKEDSNGLIHIKVENLYDFDLEYSFYKELSRLHKVNNTDKKENEKKEDVEIENNKEKYENSTIKVIEKEEEILNSSLEEVKKSKKSLIDLKGFINKLFSKNNSDKEPAYKK